jgi:hypothetical protein
MKCIDCRFAQGMIEPAIDLTCHWYPPQSVVLQTGDWVTSSEFPDVQANDWCGEYAPDSRGLPKNVSPSNSSTESSN